jgi:SprT protein
MESLLHLFTWYPLFAVPAGIGWGAVYVAGGKNFDLQIGDKALMLAPWLALNLASWLWPGDKTLANLGQPGAPRPPAGGRRQRSRRTALAAGAGDPGRRPRPGPRLIVEQPPAAASGYRPDRIEARIDELLDRARAAGWPVRAYRLCHDLRGQAAGQARPADGLLRFNTVLGGENWDDFVANTVAHEVAHLLAFWRDGAAAVGHGPAWREAMALFGCAPRRCHGYDTGNSTVRRQRQWPYRCACPEPHLLTTTRHYRVQRRSRLYRCRRCGEALAYSG